MISKSEVEHIAKLARLGLTSKEEKEFQKELSSILDYVQQLREASIAGIEPLSHPHSIENVKREDRIQKQDLKTVNELVQSFPGRKGRRLKVKAILR